MAGVRGVREQPGWPLRVRGGLKARWAGEEVGAERKEDRCPWGLLGRGASPAPPQAPRSSPPHLHFSCLSP